MVRVTFLHPDLGIGGAERLVVDAALALKKYGHEVNLVTTRYDRTHSFLETTDGSLPAVIVVGDWLPRHIFGKFFALCAYVRMIYAAFAIYFMGLNPDVVFCDLVSICIPVLKLFVPRVIFYCHHPDKLLSKSGGRFKSFYRLPLDYLEETTTGKADKVLVNSLYTQSVFKESFHRLSKSPPPQILYPSINTSFFDRDPIPLVEILGKALNKEETFLLSINRYERKKNLSLAIEAFAKLNVKSIDRKVKLVMAGGYDQKVRENVEHYEELIELAKKLGVEEKTIFLKSPSDVAKISLLKRCAILIYTPSNEHFGIVPLEAMYCKKAVIATNSGGPKESVINGVTGYLVEPTAKAFATKIQELVSDESLRNAFGEAGRKTFDDKFTFEAFARRLNRVVNDLFEEN